MRDTKNAKKTNVKKGFMVGLRLMTTTKIGEKMKQHDLLAYLTIKYDGDWDKIYNHIKNKVWLDKEDMRKTLSKVDLSDFERMSEDVIHEWVLYHSAGDSIVSTVLTGIFGEMLESDYEKTIKEVTQRISEEKKCSTR